MAVWGAIVFASSCPTLYAQFAAYDPYAPAEKEEPPIKADGSLNWPTFYKSQLVEARYENLWKMGSCGGTNKRITVPVEKNKVDVNRLPEIAVEGEVVRVGSGMLWVRQTNGTIRTIATHPAGVSAVDVHGDVLARSLQPGMVVRMVSSVDQVGHGKDVLTELDVVSVSPGFEPEAIEPEHRQSIVAAVARLRGDQLTLKTPVGKLHRLAFLINDDTIAHLMVNSLAYAAVGDHVTAKGRVYEAQDHVHWVFASEVNVTKPERKPREATNDILSSLESLD
ncbi:hypothetical protein [Bremerella cremea]|uniref:hypothetical protein n=1 Tax=Bremerella cremea TaxID=1031537 RepID=UPI0031EAD0D7